ncbi:MAG: tRNA (N(6)-L-threonylcarbamoyladenosine(37)-C(2))-methylthiotransferase MtaB [Paludibacteraceae bacterium]|nr:tRNA (N(6)-L-threonylcarbamoyladenosine(37)-C(2))-methylthiotransferase MtaB [Paludibacteraceae bacterium]
MKIAFLTLGCKLNFAESSALGKELVARGHTRVRPGEQADVCIVNTCSVTDTADHKDRQAIHRIRRQYPDAFLIVTGCYAQLRPGDIAAIDGVDCVLGMNEKFGIPALVDRLEKRAAGEGTMTCVGRIRDITDYYGSWSKDDRTRCFLKVQDGCDYFCTYCTIPYARGRSRNTTVQATVAEARKALEAGAKELVLTGVNIGDFGKSTGETFLALLQAIDALDGEFRVRISSCEPNLLSDEIIDFVARSRHFAPHFHIPLQSGSNEVLRIMKRRYTRELFAERVEHIRSLMPDAFIGVDCMVGVRGETEACFDDYVRFIEALPVSQLHVFTYSERAGTRMLELDLPVVPQAERKRRSEVLHRISQQKTEAFYAAHKGRQAVVLWEAKREGSALDGYTMSGFTANYIRLSRPYDKSLVNTFQTVTI